MAKLIGCSTQCDSKLEASFSASAIPVPPPIHTIEHNSTAAQLRSTTFAPLSTRLTPQIRSLEQVYRPPHCHGERS